MKLWGCCVKTSSVSREVFCLLSLETGKEMIRREYGTQRCRDESGSINIVRG